MSAQEKHRLPPKEVVRSALKGLELRGRFRRGGTAVGVARARDLGGRRHISDETIVRMVSYFARHRVDKRSSRFGDEQNPSAGYIAWLLWGGDAGEAWSAREKDKMD